MYVYNAIVTRVVDGDTVDADIDLGFEVHTHTRLRLAGIDAPELRGAEKEKGKEAKAYLDSLLAAYDGKVVIETGKKGSKGKYGRWVARLWLREDFAKAENKDDLELSTLNSKMVEQGHAEWSRR